MKKRCCLDILTSSEKGNVRWQVKVGSENSKNGSGMSEKGNEVEVRIQKWEVKLRVKGQKWKVENYILKWAKLLRKHAHSI